MSAMVERVVLNALVTALLAASTNLTSSSEP